MRNQSGKACRIRRFSAAGPKARGTAPPMQEAGKRNTSYLLELRRGLAIPAFDLSLHPEGNRAHTMRGRARAPNRRSAACFLRAGNLRLPSSRRMVGRNDPLSDRWQGGRLTLPRAGESAGSVSRATGSQRRERGKRGVLLPTGLRRTGIAAPNPRPQEGELR